MIEQNASDLHLKVGRPPTLRVNGELVPLDLPPLEPEDLKALAEQIDDAEAGEGVRRDRRKRDFAIGVPGIGRFRVNVYQQRGTIAYAMRAIPYQAQTIDRAESAERSSRRSRCEPRGLVLVTGITGSGKSTALAAMIQHINETAPRERHHDRGSDRVPASRHQLAHQPARGRHRHGELRAGAAPRAASGSRRHPHR